MRKPATSNRVWSLFEVTGPASVLADPGRSLIVCASAVMPQQQAERGAETGVASHMTPIYVAAGSAAREDIRLNPSTRANSPG